MQKIESLDELITKKAVEFADQIKAVAAMADKEEEIRIGADFLCTSALARIASIQNTHNDRAGATQTAKMALAFARGIENPLTRAWGLVLIADALD
jgi:hypothetical protein